MELGEFETEADGETIAVRVEEPEIEALRDSTSVLDAVRLADEVEFPLALMLGETLIDRDGDAVEDGDRDIVVDTEDDRETLALVVNKIDAVSAAVVLPPSVDCVELAENDDEVEIRGDRVVDVDIDALRDSSPLRLDDRFDEALNVELVLTVEDELGEREDEPDAAGDVDNRALDDADTPTDVELQGLGFDDELKLDDTDADPDATVVRVDVPDEEMLRDSGTLLVGVDRVVRDIVPLALVHADTDDERDGDDDSDGEMLDEGETDEEREGFALVDDDAHRDTKPDMLARMVGVVLTELD